MSQPRLSYRMPQHNLGKSVFLCELMRLPPDWVAYLSPDDRCRLLTDICLYRHLDQQTRRSVLERIEEAPGPRQARLRELVYMPIALPHWGIWRLTTEELLQQHEFKDAIARLGALLGMTFSAETGRGWFRNIRRRSLTTGTGAGAVATIGIWGFFWMNEESRRQIQEELFRRAAVQG